MEANKDGNLDIEPREDLCGTTTDINVANDFAFGELTDSLLRPLDFQDPLWSMHDPLDIAEVSPVNLVSEVANRSPVESPHRDLLSLFNDGPLETADNTQYPSFEAFSEWVNQDEQVQSLIPLSLVPLQEQEHLSGPRFVPSLETLYFPETACIERRQDSGSHGSVNSAAIMAQQFQPCHDPGFPFVTTDTQSTAHSNAIPIGLEAQVPINQLQTVYDALCVQMQSTQAAMHAIKRLQAKPVEASEGDPGSNSFTSHVTNTLPLPIHSLGPLLSNNFGHTTVDTASRMNDIEIPSTESYPNQSQDFYGPMVSAAAATQPPYRLDDTTLGVRQKRHGDLSPSLHAPHPPKKRRKAGKTRPCETCYASWVVCSSSQGNKSAVSSPRGRVDFNKRPCAICQFSQKRVRGSTFPP